MTRIVGRCGYCHRHIVVLFGRVRCCHRDDCRRPRREVA